MASNMQFCLKSLESSTRGQKYLRKQNCFHIFSVKLPKPFLYAMPQAITEEWTLT